MNAICERPKLLPAMQVSKWLRVPLLLGSEEMAALFDNLKNFELYATWRTTQPEDEKIGHADFLAIYQKYVDALRGRETPDSSLYAGFFSSTMTVSSDLLYAVPIQSNQRLIRALRPVIQLQPHTLGYSAVDETFRSMVVGPDSISWGIQFAYPQIFQDSETKEIVKIDNSSQFPNTALFKKLQHWVRENTLPTTFIVGGKSQTVSQRVGKQALHWINCHPQLSVQQITVKK